jgi:hypothetical protein
MVWIKNFNTDDIYVGADLPLLLFFLGGGGQRKTTTIRSLKKATSSGRLAFSKSNWRPTEARVNEAD